MSGWVSWVRFSLRAIGFDGGFYVVDVEPDNFLESEVRDFAFFGPAVNGGDGDGVDFGDDFSRDEGIHGR